MAAAEGRSRRHRRMRRRGQRDQRRNEAAAARSAASPISSLLAWFAISPLSVWAGHYRRGTCIFESRFVSPVVKRSHMTHEDGGPAVGDPDEMIAPASGPCPGWSMGMHILPRRRWISPRDLEGANAPGGDGAPCRCGVDPRQGWRDLTVVHLIDGPVEPRDRGSRRVLQVDAWFREGLPRRGSGDVGERPRLQPKRERAGSSWSVTGRGKAWVRSQTSMRRRWGRPWRRREEHEGQGRGTHHGPRSPVGSSGGSRLHRRRAVLSDHDLEMLGARGGCWVPTVVQMEATISQLGERSSGGRLLIEVSRT